MALSEAAERLLNFLRPQCRGGAALAYSGGVDSALLLAALACVCAPERRPLHAVTFAGDFQTPEEIAAAERTAAALPGVTFAVLPFAPLADPRLAENPPERCYFCKHALYSSLLAYAEKHGLPWVAEGSNADDLQTRRPGLRALRELAVASPLAELGITKREVRALAAEFGLAVADRPSTPCLATRFPYGTHLTGAALARVARGEALLKAAGFSPLRLRVHGEIARIEIAPAQFAAFLEQRERLMVALHQLGFRYVTLDCDGFRSGSMDGD